MLKSCTASEVLSDHVKGTYLKKRWFNGYRTWKERYKGSGKPNIFKYLNKSRILIKEDLYAEGMLKGWEDKYGDKIKGFKVNKND